MTKPRLLAASVLVLLVSCLAFAARAQDARNAGADEATVRGLDEQERRAVLAADTAALERLWSERLIVNNPLGRVSGTRRDVLDLVGRGLIRYTTFERTIEAVRQNGDVVIVMGAEEVLPAGDAPKAGQVSRRRFTNVWMKEAGTWRMIGRHANAAPPN